MCIALISPENRERAAGSFAAPADSSISSVASPPSSCATKAVPAGVEVTRASSQKSPTFTGSSSSSGKRAADSGRSSGALVSSSLLIEHYRTTSRKREAPVARSRAAGGGALSLAADHVPGTPEETA